SGLGLVYYLAIRQVRQMRALAEEREQAAETAARLVALVESSDDAIVGKTLEGVITSWNHGAENLFGYTAEEMIGHSVSRIVPPDRADDLRLILGAIGRGESVEHYETE